MDGQLMLYHLRNLLQEGSTSTFMDDRTSYDVLYEAACALESELKINHALQTITTVATTATYNINTNYLCLDMKNDFNEFVIQYYDTVSDNYWITWREENFIRQANSSSDSSIPSNFSIIENTTLPSNIVSTATAVGAASGGECTLTDSTAPFTNTTVGDLVHNITDGSNGVVVSVTSTSAVVTALFGGTNNDWTGTDSYVIVPQPRKQILIDPPSLTSGHSIYFRYICKPDPVYSSYRRYKIPDIYMPAVVKYAAWLYKYRDRQPNFGDSWYKFWEMQLRRAKMNENRNPDKYRFGVSLRKLSLGNRSRR